MKVKIAVIGAGPGGYAAAIRAARMGAEVTVVEQDNVGGTCLNIGCIPSKIMQTTAVMMEKFKRAAEFGIETSGVFRTDIPALMARKRRIIKSQANGMLKVLNDNEIRFMHGTGYIQRPNLAVVKPDDQKTVELPWDRLILAPGTYPTELPGVSFNGSNVISSNEALSLEAIPESILIIGGGVIGCEFAFILAALGSAVTVVEALSRVLPIESVDEDCSKILAREMKKKKIKLMVNQIVESIEDAGDQCRVTISPSPFVRDLQAKNTKSTTVTVEKILVCVGRKPDTAGMGLEKTGIKTDKRGWIKVDEKMETSAPGVYAIGDILGPSKSMLAHTAAAEGIVAAENAFGKNRVMDYKAVPSAIFTMPEVANVGLTESQAKKQGYNARSDSILFRMLGKAHVIDAIAGQAKIVSDADSKIVLGVHIIGPHATELIAEGSLAVRQGLTVMDIAATIHAHPTLSEIMLEASQKAAGS
ncbi:MAG: dihydrolipoyl dehydrogenase [Thermodesulfobacteriota bacterium]|nr:dihydrolipoyl dehydrogenase [Thermodesulfobacteriota bacterium]